MTAENESRYLHSFESEHISPISWVEMLDRGVVLAPHKVLLALEQAEKFLVTTPGPNLQRRKVLAPEWFGYWKRKLENQDVESEDGLVSSADKLVKFDEIARFLFSKYGDERTGMSFVAGAEGHKGHVYAAKYMARVVPVTIWGFEQDEYMQRKDRKAPFLSLPLRLSMWVHEGTLTHLTVLPRNTRDLPDNDHYNELFVHSGVKYFFVHEKDPYLTEKLARGEQDLDRTISHDFTDLSTTEVVQELTHGTMSIEEITNLFVMQNLRVIPDLPVENTTLRVQKQWPQLEDGSKNIFSPRYLTDDLMYEYNHSGRDKSVGYNDSISVE
jgi:hypothetical protein